jgi:hypothetical protein
MDIGPVLHVDDVLASKVAAMVTRAEPRDYIDVDAALRVRSADELRRLAKQADPEINEVAHDEVKPSAKPSPTGRVGDTTRSRLGVRRTACPGVVRDRNADLGAKEPA